jgi:DNA repair ATPase RecN
LSEHHHQGSGHGPLVGSEAPDPPSLHAAYSASRLERDRTLRAVHRLEAALSMAAEGEQWLDEVVADLDALESAMVAEQLELNRPDALLALIAAEHPRRFRSRVRNLREQYDDLIRQLASLRRQLDRADRTRFEAEDLRHRASWLIRALHHCRGRQADLVFDALEMDLGER